MRIKGISLIIFAVLFLCNISSVVLANDPPKRLGVLVIEIEQPSCERSLQLMGGDKPSDFENAKPRPLPIRYHLMTQSQVLISKVTLIPESADLDVDNIRWIVDKFFLGIKESAQQLPGIDTKEAFYIDVILKRYNVALQVHLKTNISVKKNKDGTSINSDGHISEGLEAELNRDGDKKNLRASYLAGEFIEFTLMARGRKVELILFEELMLNMLNKIKDSLKDQLKAEYLEFGAANHNGAIRMSDSFFEATGDTLKTYDGSLRVMFRIPIYEDLPKYNTSDDVTDFHPPQDYTPPTQDYTPPPPLAD